jgi:hypothetical protein
VIVARLRWSDIEMTAKTRRDEGRLRSADVSD